MNPAFVFLWEDGESNGARLARCAHESLIHGPMGNTLNGDWYESVLRVWDREEELRRIRTSCAVYMSTLLGWCGWPLNKPWNGMGGWGIMSYPLQNGGLSGSWLNPLGYHHSSWVWAKGNTPESGDIFYRDYSKKATNSGHVGMFTDGEGNMWNTAEGGGAPDGTGCRASAAPKDIKAKDSMGRVYVGWWKAALLDLPTDVSMMPRE